MVSILRTKHRRGAVPVPANSFHKEDGANAKTRHGSDARGGTGKSGTGRSGWGRYLDGGRCSKLTGTLPRDSPDV